MASIFARFFGRTVSEGAAFAAGLAVGPALAPGVQEVVNETWTLFPVKRVDPGTAAEIVAEDVEQRDWGAAEAAAHGIDGTRFDAIVGEVLNAPGLGPLFELWRRQLITDAQFTHGLRKAKLEGLWDGPLEGLRETLLSSEELAMMQQQGFVDETRANAEGGLQGVTSERQQLRFEASGLPPGVETGLDMLRRGIIDEATFAQIVREGHTKTKYTDDLLALRTPVLSASEYATLHLKGHITAAEMNAGGALSGYTPEQMNLLYLAMGRPAAPGQMWTAAARGIDGPAGRPVDQAQFQTAIAQSDIRPEYGPMLWEIRYLYPSLFQLTRLVSSQTITPDVGADWARKARYAPEVVDALLQSWGGTGTAKADAHVAKAQTQFWNTLHRTYLSGETDEATVTAALPQAGVDAAAVPDVLAVWDAERALTRKQLSFTQLRKAYVDGLISQDEVANTLHERGYSPGDIQVAFEAWAKGEKF